MAFGIEGTRVRLAPLDADRHLENCYRWVNDTNVTDHLAIGHLPITRLQESEIFEKFQRPGDSDIVWAIETLDGRHIGMSGLHQISLLHGTAKSGSFLGESVERGQGFGTEAAELRSCYAFVTLGLRMLYSEYFEGNGASQRMQEKCGYQTWGVKPAAEWKNGQFRNLVQTYLPRSRWLELNATNE